MAHLLAANNLSDRGRKALVVATDVMVEEQLENLVDKAWETFGRIDILVNNAGGFPPKPALDTTAPGAGAQRR